MGVRLSLSVEKAGEFHGCARFPVETLRAEAAQGL
jgi:hypothetical protein